MSFLKRLKLRFVPLLLQDPELGQMRFMYISHRPENSYWECEWFFPPTKTNVFLPIRGTEEGPNQQHRKFYLDLVARFDFILQASRPQLAAAYKQWADKELPSDIFSAFELAAFGLEDPGANPVHWEVSFEATGETWIYVTISFVGNEAQSAVVDT
ncbi:hypothetical protein CH373_06100 [Leptospira perolatii]|uniref:Uncharacterized protein n=1 Tax=Leptospira perolatii TaxID=2023191 RepID=A0A2M9ZP04_9LEPT|nr:hypothetical protein [Leptospira perolatii]PJZ70839.1 hypothetical protein CH360_04830 [Leptospira perolatii]PJZ73735.1 hypothetical protein CH373_06100 [Leptospira perolatii]